MTQPNFIKDAEEQAELGFGPRAVDFLVRLDPKEIKPADAVIKQLIEDWDENFLLEVASDAEKLRLKLDEAGVDLVVHAVSRCIKPGTRELELFLQHDIVTLSLQDSKGNCALHYLAWNGVDLLGQLPIRRLLIRNLNGATPLHLQAKKQIARERILALPTEILKLKTKRGATIENALQDEPHEPILQEVAQARVAAEPDGDLVITKLDSKLLLKILESFEPELVKGHSTKMGVVIDCYRPKTAPYDVDKYTVFFQIRDAVTFDDDEKAKALMISLTLGGRGFGNHAIKLPAQAKDIQDGIRYGLKRLGVRNVATARADVDADWPIIEGLSIRALANALSKFKPELRRAGSHGDQLCFTCHEPVLFDRSFYDVEFVLFRLRNTLRMTVWANGNKYDAGLIELPAPPSVIRSAMRDAIQYFRGFHATARVASEQDPEVSLDELVSLDKITCGQYKISLTNFQQRHPVGTYCVNFIVESVKDANISVHVTHFRDSFLIDVENEYGLNLRHVMKKLKLSPFRKVVASLVSELRSKKTEARVASEQDNETISSPDDLGKSIEIGGTIYERYSSREIGRALQVSFMDRTTFGSKFPSVIEVTLNKMNEPGYFAIGVISGKQRADKSIKVDELTMKLLKTTVHELLRKIAPMYIHARVASERDKLNWDALAQLKSLRVDGDEFELKAHSFGSPVFVGEAKRTSLSGQKTSAIVTIKFRYWRTKQHTQIMANVSTFVSERDCEIPAEFEMRDLQKKLELAIDDLLDDYFSHLKYGVSARVSSEQELVTIERLAETKQIDAGDLHFKLDHLNHRGDDSVSHVTFVAETELGDLYMYFSDHDDRVGLHGSMSRAIDRHGDVYIPSDMPGVKQAMKKLAEKLLKKQRESQ